MVDLATTVALASRAKTKVKRLGNRGICDLSFDEIKALAFIADVMLADYDGPLTRVDVEVKTPPQTPESETT